MNNNNYKKNPLVVKSTFTTNDYNVTIAVNSLDNGMKPHFHVFNKESRNSKKRIDCCIYLNKAEYFLHGIHIKPINDKAILESVIEKLKETIVDDISNERITKWKYLVREWNRGNRSKCYAKRIPNYITIWKDKQ